MDSTNGFSKLQYTVVCKWYFFNIERSLPEISSFSNYQHALFECEALNSARHKFHLHYFEVKDNHGLN